MKKSVAIILLLIFFLVGVAFGASSETKPSSQASAASNLTQHIQQYEAWLKDEETEVYIPYSQTIPDNPDSTSSSYVSAIEHNSVSQFGQDAGDMLKTIVREILRTVVKLCDQWVTS